VTLRLLLLVLSSFIRGPSIYDINTEGDEVRPRWMHAAGESATFGHPHRKLKPTDVILSSSHAKKSKT